MKRAPQRKGLRRSKNSFVTKKGQTIKFKQTMFSKYKATKEVISVQKAKRLSGLPKSRIKRLFYHMNPKRMYHYWFSKEGGVMTLKITGYGIIFGFVLLIGLFAYFRKDLSNITDISGTNIGGSVLYYDKTGQTLLWEDVDGVKRIPVKGSEISNYMKQATVAVEDKDFFNHGGFDVRGILRAGINDVLHIGGTKQGGSTITQQLVRLTAEGVGNEQTITRKLKELVLSVEYERSYNKDEILTGYLNAAPYGGIEYGVQAAANNYFNKSAKDLTLDEAAMLAAIPKSPGVYSKYSDNFRKDSLVGRQSYILDQMVGENMITKKQAEEAKKVDTVAKIQLRPTHYAGIKAPYFVLAAKSELEIQFGAKMVRQGGWKVTTTLDMALQTKAEELVSSNLKNSSRYKGDSQALVAEDVETGQIVSLVGGSDFNNPVYGNINYAHSAFIPPGSSIKPYDYATLIENGTNVGAGSVLYDSATNLPGYPCPGKCLTDYDKLQPGPITLRYALGGSRNIPAVKAMLLALPNDKSNGKIDSINKTISTIDAMMYNPNNPHTYKCYKPGTDINNSTAEDESQCYGASAIGDGAFLHLDDHVNGFSTLARLGSAIPRTYILKITDAGNKTIFQWKKPKATQPLRPDTAYIVNDMASDPNASYLPGSFYKFHRQKNGWNFAVKTGTTNDGYDGLMASWSTKYAVVTWVGNHTRTVTLGTSMEILTTPLAKGWMEYAHANLKPVNWTKPVGVKTLPAFVVRNHINHGSVEPSPENDLYPSWYVPKTAISTNQSIDSISNKLASSCTPELAKKTVTGGSALIFSIDQFVTGSNAITDSSSSDDVHHCDDIKPAINIAANDPTCSSTCNITVSVTQGTHPLSSATIKGTINILIDGQIVQSSNTDISGSIPIAFTYNGTGNKSVTAQIIDSVLYDSSSSAVTINFTNDTITLDVTPVSPGPNNYKFTWNYITSGSPYQICKSSNSTPLTCSTGTTGAISALSGSNKKAYIKADNGVQSPIVSF